MFIKPRSGPKSNLYRLCNLLFLMHERVNRRINRRTFGARTICHVRGHNVLCKLKGEQVGRLSGAKGLYVIFYLCILFIRFSRSKTDVIFGARRLGFHRVTRNVKRSSIFRRM